MKDDKKTQSNCEYHQNYDGQKIYEPEYFLELFNLDLKQDYSCNLNIGQSEKQKESFTNQYLNNQEFVSQFDLTNQQYLSYFNQQEIQINANQQQQYINNSLISYDNSNYKNQQFNQSQNSFENKNEIIQNQSNVQEQFFLKTENNNNSTSKIKNDTQGQKESVCEIQLLMNFLENESINWLERSKVVNKQEVQEKILFLQNCISDPKKFDELTIY
ncbi:hypothetical protein TTHERM_00430110 (macronuclear) [Tetrahymena thermophila SB210]|uniref:Uncharacterized protein n=1 Tax=Tetrahymena thermophila (strain SB210) TaxID=312017 RepID=Q231E9_TETTS|nr:hypothetical protein TTHERM_00430110 [Tetrahymena thermophila SB210]EAR91090.2 hypothetical protein TTHERM_00430110 [Tetrahymena thermophila SB210]|eukprot:XP_001011335.2 hypothetical protein TTHERM_00430110 [Tetrahymena thermophila SB210]